MKKCGYMSKKISFIPSSEEHYNFVDFPEPAKNFVPDWYKNAEIPIKNKIEFSEENVIKNRGIKSCMPFFDAISSGYIQKTWTDIFISVENGELFIRSSCGPEILGTREYVNVEIDEMFYSIEFVWKTAFVPKIPNGYSMLFTHPLNRLDLPFFTTSGVIDSDKFYHVPNGNVPFYIKSNFTGIIPAGTPMYQMIPIKRDSWSSNVEEYSLEHEKNFRKSSKYFMKFYKNNFWNKKNYK